MEPFWESGYRDMKVSSMGGPSFEVAEIFPALPLHAKVLDLGCGEGRNAFFLAQKGCVVTAVDHSQAGIQKLLAMCDKYQVPITTKVQNIKDFTFTEAYDLVMAHGVLYYLENAEWRKLLTEVKKYTRQGGFNIFTLFVYNEQYPCGEEIAAAHYKHSFRPNELKEFYHDWILHRYDTYVKWDSHPGLPLHYHPIEKLVSQKPLIKIHKSFFDTGSDMDEQEFHDIKMGISTDELIKRVGKPHTIKTASLEGLQFGSYHLEENYDLHLWHYGKHVIYVSNNLVTGRALYSSPPCELNLSI